MSQTLSIHSIPETEICYSKSTLQIPLRYANYFKMKCCEYGSRQAYFHFMAVHYLCLNECFRSRLEKRCSHKWKTQFQAGGQLLDRRNFVPLPDDWERFRNVACAFGVSICFLFVFLMEQEMANFFTQKNLQTARGWHSTSNKSGDRGKSGKFSIFLRILEEGRSVLNRIQRQ